MPRILPVSFRVIQEARSLTLATFIQHCDTYWVDGEPEFRKRGLQERLIEAAPADHDVFVYRRGRRSIVDGSAEGPQYNFAFWARDDDEMLARFCMCVVLAS